MKFLKYSYRFFLKFKAYTLLNILGMTMAALLLTIGVMFFSVQLNYDNFHKDYVYRVQLGGDENAPKLFPALAEQLVNHFSEIHQATRLKKATLNIQYKQSRVSDLESYYVDSTFFDVLNYTIIYGTKYGLDRPFTVYLSQRLAGKLSKNISSLVGKTVSIPKRNGIEEYFIGGILENVPQNSHLKFDILVSYNTLDEGKSTFKYGWAFKGVNTYIKTEKPFSLSKKDGQDFLTRIKESSEHSSVKPEETLSFIPISKVHYLPNMMPDEKYGNKMINYALLSLFILLLITLIFNYYGSSVIISHFRKKSLRLKKVLGASAYRILLEKMIENFIILMFSVILSWLIFALNENFFFKTFNISKQTILANIGTVTYSLILLSIVFVFIPGIQSYIHSKRMDLRGRLVINRNVKNPFDKVLIIQITISLILIIVSIGIYKQVHFIGQQNNVIETQNILVVDPPQTSQENNKRLVLKNKLNDLAFVKDITFSNSIPFQHYNQLWWGVRYNHTEDYDKAYAIIDIDKDYFRTYNIDILQGRNVNESRRNDIVVNKKFVNEFSDNKNLSTILNKRVILREDTFRIVGVVEDYYHLSSKSNIIPTVYRMLDSDNAFLSVQTKSETLPTYINNVKDTWNEVYPDELFVYNMLKDGYNKIVEDDVHLLSIASLLALLVFILSIFSLIVTISVKILKQQKEFAIRRIVGAGQISNIKLIFKKYLVGLAIAGIVSTAFSNMVLSYWLNDYINKVDISVMVFVMPYALFFIVTFIITTIVYLIKERTTPITQKLDQ